jgi:hypothetical protein
MIEFHVGGLIKLLSVIIVEKSRTTVGKVLDEIILGIRKNT